MRTTLRLEAMRGSNFLKNLNYCGKVLRLWIFYLVGNDLFKFFASSTMNMFSLKLFVLLAGMCCLGYTANAQELRSTGMASTYASSEVGMPTASGAIYESTAYTACHATLPFGTVVRVTNLRNNTSVLVTINDRFDYKTNRLIDVSHAAAKELELFSNVAPLVSIEVVSWPTEETKNEVPSNEG